MTLYYLSLGALLVQLCYLTFLLIRLSRKSPSGNEPAEAVSVVICAHDEEQNLRELVPLLLDQDYPDFEIIVVEDRCNDGTYDYLREAVLAHPKLKLVRVEHKPDYANGKKFGVTLGIRAASADWILLTDADCRPTSRHWIATMARHMTADKAFVLGVSPYQKFRGWLNAFIRYETLFTSTTFSAFALAGRPYMGVGRNLAYRKSTFLQHKGFADLIDVTGGDDDLFVNRHATARNTAVCLIREGNMISIPKKSWKEYYVQKLRHLAAGKRYRLSDQFLLGLFSAAMIFSWLAPLAMVAGQHPEWLAVLFIMRWGLMIWLTAGPARKMGLSAEWWKVPVLDFIYVFYYLGTGLVALFSKRVRWKT